jgi:hypothetical protein
LRPPDWATAETWKSTDLAAARLGDGGDLEVDLAQPDLLHVGDPPVDAVDAVAKPQTGPDCPGIGPVRVGRGERRRQHDRREQESADGREALYRRDDGGDGDVDPRAVVDLQRDHVADAEIEGLGGQEVDHRGVRLGSRWKLTFEHLQALFGRRQRGRADGADGKARSGGELTRVDFDAIYEDRLEPGAVLDGRKRLHFVEHVSDRALTFRQPVQCHRRGIRPFDESIEHRGCPTRPRGGELDEPAGHADQENQHDRGTCGRPGCASSNRGDRRHRPHHRASCKQTEPCGHESVGGVGTTSSGSSTAVEIRRYMRRRSSVTRRIWGDQRYYERR